MSEIQTAILTKFNLVIGVHKAGLKEALTAKALPPNAFFGALKSQLKKQDETEFAAALMASEKAAPMPHIQAEALDSTQPATEPAAAKPLPAPPPTPVVELPAQLQPLPVPAPSAAPLAQQGLVAPPPPPPAAETLPEVELKSIGTAPALATRSTGTLQEETIPKGSGAAIAAGNGQALPFESFAEPSRALVTATSPEVEQALAEPPLASGTPLLAPRSDSPASPVTLAHPFVQALRQAETRINAAIEAPLRSPAFVPELGDKVIWLASRQGQFAELSLTPPQMGTLEVRLTLSGSDASAQFFSANPVVREVIDGALPRLRELMSQAGINLGETEVRGEAFERREQTGAREQTSTTKTDIPTHPLVAAGIGRAISSGSGLVDLYI